MLYRLLVKKVSTVYCLTLILLIGFSIISGFEILYWLLFKVLFHKSGQQVAPEEKTCAKCGAE